MIRISIRNVLTVTFLLTILSLSLMRIPFAGAESPRASLTGNVYDEGVDKDGDGKFDLLQIGVEFNVSDPGWYDVKVYNLISESYQQLFIEGRSESAYFETGINVVNVSLYGPTIYASSINPLNISEIRLDTTVDYPYIPHTIYNVPLSREYSYTEFDAPFKDVEARFIVYPNGTVTLAGALDYSDMVVSEVNSPNTGPTMQGVIGITKDGGLVVASADYIMEIPPKEASEFPFNSTIVSILETYSEGNVQSELNATMTLPAGIAAEYPFNTTDVAITGTYSDGIFNLQLDFLTALPSYIASTFPFNITDISAVGEYSNNVAQGTITFHMVSGFPLGDINIEFQGNQTDLNLMSDITFIYDVMSFELPLPFPQFPLNKTTLDEWLLEINSTLPETGPHSLYNMTMGLFECTQFTTTPTYGTTSADVTFNATVHGNFIKALAFIMSGPAQNMMLCPLLNATLSSVDTLSFQVAYTVSSKQVSLSLTFAYDLRSLVEYLAAPEARYFAVAGMSMDPTLLVGDIVRVESIADPSQIVANNETGDIIAFYKPSDPNVIVVHRAVDKFFNTTTGEWYFKTKGDNNPSPDPWLVPHTSLIGKVVTCIPYIGNLMLYPPIPSMYIPPMSIPPEIPLQLLNHTFSMLKDASVKLEYSSTNKEFQVNLTATSNLSEYWDEIAALLPDVAPLEIKPFVELLLNTTYCSMESYNESMSYQNGIVHFESTYVIEGDLTAEINHIKQVMMNLLKIMTGVESLPWQLVFLNQTTIDINKLQMNFNYGNTSLTVDFDDLTLTPPIDPVDSDPTQFKLERFFNLTADYPFPSSGEQLKLIVEGGNNVTHAVTLISTGSVPTPNETGPNNSYMIWYNESISNIKDLIFKIEPQTYTARVLVVDQVGDPVQNVTVEVYWPNGTLYMSLTTDDFGYTTTFAVDYAYMPYGEYNITATYLEVSTTKSLIVSYSGVYTINLSIEGSQTTGTITNPETVNATNPFIIDAMNKTSSKLIITEIDKPVEIAIRNVTTLPENVEPPPGTLKALSNYVEIIANETDVAVNATIRIYYTLEQLSELGLDESSLQIHYWNATEGKWIPVESHINTDEHYVWAVVNHFSIWALFGQPSPFWTQIWFLASITCVIVAIVAIVVIFAIKKKKKPPPKKTEQ
ncbi:signal peptidase I [Candidatus Bathyarchaeota archaeon]|nr:signal peptidase I [Candidatus Bathyarchaeota archaeon]